MKFSHITIAASLALSACAPTNESLDTQRTRQQAESARRAAMLQEQIRQFEKTHPSPPRLREIPEAPVPASIRRPVVGEMPSRPYTLPDYSSPVQASPRVHDHDGRSQDETEKERVSGKVWWRSDQ